MLLLPRIWDEGFLVPDEWNWGPMEEMRGGGVCRMAHCMVGVSRAHVDFFHFFLFAADQYMYM